MGGKKKKRIFLTFRPLNVIFLVMALAIHFINQLTNSEYLAYYLYCKLLIQALRRKNPSITLGNDVLSLILLNCLDVVFTFGFSVYSSNNRTTYMRQLWISVSDGDVNMHQLCASSMLIWSGREMENWTGTCSDPHYRTRALVN